MELGTVWAKKDNLKTSHRICIGIAYCQKCGGTGNAMEVLNDGKITKFVDDHKSYGECKCISGNWYYIPFKEMVKLE